ncbi:hypothetical protein FRC09_016287 [Ceratobasidium sp. 395]|nr:hypothetical protein FRC09_016287 [Ceratobasidium sp. 395]
MDNHPLNTSLYGNPLISVISDEGEAEVAAGPVAQALSGVVHNNHGEPTQLNQAESHQSGQNSLPTREDSRRGKQVFSPLMNLAE